MDRFVKDLIIFKYDNHTISDVQKLSEHSYKEDTISVILITIVLTLVSSSIFLYCMFRSTIQKWPIVDSYEKL